MALRRNSTNCRLLSAMILALGLLISCASNSPVTDTNIELINWEPDNPDFRFYYGWDEKIGTWKLERLQNMNGETVAIHIFRPPFFKWKKGTVFLIHGYLEHSALRVQLIKELVKKGWIVVGMDLPGHGLSTGVRADIADFSEYLSAFELTMASRYWPRPWRAVGHSTGGATILMAMQNPDHKFNLVVLEAPLVRTFMWSPFIWLKNFTEDWVSVVGRRSGTHDEQDPFYIDEVPLHWFDAVNAYYLSTSSWIAVKGQVLILQGDSDTVVDRKFNIPFLQGILPDAELITIAGGKHQLLLAEGQVGDDARQKLFLKW